MAAANSAGGTLGKMISLQTIAIAAGATGLSTLEQVKLFRFTLRRSVMLLLGGAYCPSLHLRFSPNLN
jgi:lactate permease